MAFLLFIGSWFAFLFAFLFYYLADAMPKIFFILILYLTCYFG